ncbi:MAG: carbohydrate porin [Melioribacteraceae bacterium]|nr:carbohydrate porin [Melioribacteraceae bacterium]
MKHKIFLLLFLSLAVVIKAQNQSIFGTSDSTLSFNSIQKFNYEASYIGDFAGNLSGGIKTGSLFLGMANIRIGFETKNIGLWNGGEFFLNGASTHGGTPSEKLFGDFQVASNIEAGNLTYLHELWYKHSFEAFEITIGLQDLNAEFVTSEYSGSFINSSFGIPSLIADNIPVPIFPLTALGIMGKFNLSDDIAIQAALFDGLPENFENNQYNLNWNLNSNDGVLVFSELQLATKFGNLPGTVKAGYYYHSHLKETCSETKVTETVFDKNYGFYAIADQKIFRSGENRGLGLFAQLALSPSNRNSHNYYIGGGLNYQGIFDNEGQDALGVAFAHAGFNESSLINETTIELFYKTALTENLFIQPDIQYIFNPAGIGNKLNNALAVFMRFGINF